MTGMIPAQPLQLPPQKQATQAAALAAPIRVSMNRGKTCQTREHELVSTGSYTRAAMVATRPLVVAVWRGPKHTISDWSECQRETRARTRACPACMQEGWHPTDPPLARRHKRVLARACAANTLTVQEGTRTSTHSGCKLNYARRTQPPTFQVRAIPSADGRIVPPKATC